MRTNDRLRRRIRPLEFVKHNMLVDYSLKLTAAEFDFNRANLLVEKLQLQMVVRDVKRSAHAAYTLELGARQNDLRHLCEE